MLRRILLPLIIFCTLLAAANVRSVPLLVLAIAEIVFAGLMIALALFQRSRLKLEPVNKAIHLQKGQNEECRIRVDNSSPFPVSRFRLALSHGYAGEEPERELLYGGTDKNEGFLKLTLENKYCGVNRLQLENVKSYDWFLLSAFPKKLNETMLIAVLPDKQLKIGIRQDTHSAQTGASADEREAFKASGGNEQDDIRVYRAGDPIRHIYWKQSAKMNELWVKEFKEELSSYPIVETGAQGAGGLSIKEADCFYRVLYALLAGTLEISDEFVFRRIFAGTSHEDYLIKEAGQLASILICIYRNDFRALREFYINEEITPDFVLRLQPAPLVISRDGKAVKKFDVEVSDEEICSTLINV